MLERTKTKKEFSAIPEGTYKFIISDVPIKKKTQTGKVFYEFKFEAYLSDGRMMSHMQTFFPWDMEELLHGIGATKIGDDEWEWDRATVTGKAVTADIVHEPDRKDPNKKWPRMRNITDEIPF